VCTAMTVIAPDVEMPSRSLACGSGPATRYEWRRDAVKQADYNPLFAPEIEQDCTLPSHVVSELNKTLRTRGIKAPDTGFKAAMVTGGAGFLGRYCVWELLTMPDHPDVYVVARGKDAEASKNRFLQALAEAGLRPDDQQLQRLHVINCDVGAERLGLSVQDFEDLSHRVTHIFHVAARVNHAESYADLKKDNVVGVVHLLEFAVKNKLKHFHFVSTYGLTTPDMVNPEGILSEDTPLGDVRMLNGGFSGSCEMSGGYMYSKYVAERIVMEAVKKGALCAIHRPGLIGGHSVTGHSGTDNFYNLLKDMIELGKAPRMSGPVLNLTPVDFVAYAIIHSARQPVRNWRGRVFHPIIRSGVGPSGADVEVPMLVDALTRAGHKLEMVSFAQFRSELKQRGDQCKSWLLVGVLQAEGTSLDAMAGNHRSWAAMRKAPGVSMHDPVRLLDLMVAFMTKKGWLPAPRAPGSAASAAGSERMDVPLLAV